MKLYDENKPLHLETDASVVGLGAALLQTRHRGTYQRYTAPDNTTL